MGARAVGLQRHRLGVVSALATKGAVKKVILPIIASPKPKRK